MAYTEMIALMPGLEWWSKSVQPLLERGVSVFLPESMGYGFMHRAIIECILIAPMCAAMGV